MVAVYHVVDGDGDAEGDAEGYEAEGYDQAEPVDVWLLLALAYS